MKVWITKYALTSGIMVVDAELSTTCETMIVYKSHIHDYECTQYAHIEGKDWHKTALSAINKAVKMRDAKIESLSKSIDSLNSMSYSHFLTQCGDSKVTSVGDV